MPDIIITVTASQAARVASAFGSAYTLHNPDSTPRAATAEEVRKFLLAYLKSIVEGQEREQAIQAITVMPLDVV